MDMGVQLIVFGQGDPKYIEYFNWAKAQWPGQLGFSSDYNEPTASAVFAGADMYLMPSRFALRHRADRSRDGRPQGLRARL